MEHPDDRDSPRADRASERLPTPWSSNACAAWWRQLAAASRSVLMLDYDGTLAPFRLERMEAVPYPGVAERLRRLSCEPRTRLVLISGRPARELVQLLPSDLHIEIWGSHGRERLDPDGNVTAFRPSAEQQTGLDQFESALEQSGLAAVIEKKVGSLAIHTRGLPAADAQQITSFAQETHDSLTEDANHAGLAWLPFDGGLELRALGCTKASAVRAILRRELPDAPAAYLGDDLTDEDAFTALHAHNLRARTLSVLVRAEPRPSLADLWLKPPAELLAFLDRWLAAVTRPGRPR